MKTSLNGIATLVAHEGIVPGPYRDSVSVWTWGVGHTIGAGAPDPYKMARGMPADLDTTLRAVFVQFASDLAKYEADVDRAVTVPMAQHEFDALVSFHYNTGGIARANLTKRLNAGDRKGAAAGFMGWIKPAEIIPRRKDEQTLFATGVYKQGRATVWGVDSNGRVIWKPVRTLDFSEIAKMMKS